MTSFERPPVLRGHLSQNRFYCIDIWRQYSKIHCKNYEVQNNKDADWSINPHKIITLQEHCKIDTDMLYKVHVFVFILEVFRNSKQILYFVLSILWWDQYKKNSTAILFGVDWHKIYNAIYNKQNISINKYKYCYEIQNVDAFLFDCFVYYGLRVELILSQIIFFVIHSHVRGGYCRNV